MQSFLGPANVELDGVKIGVPMVPSRDQWATVRVGKFIESVGAHKVYWRPEVVGIDTITDDLHFLGFLHRGEGRTGYAYDAVRSTSIQDGRP